MKIGNDVLEIDRFYDVSEKFISRVYTENEINYIQKFENRAEHLAGFFCVKEAVIKAFGEDVSSLSLKDVEVLHFDNGKPYVKLYGDVLKIFKKIKGKKIDISISHSKTIASAVAIIY